MTLNWLHIVLFYSLCFISETIWKINKRHLIVKTNHNFKQQTLICIYSHFCFFFLKFFAFFALFYIFAFLHFICILFAVFCVFFLRVFTICVLGICQNELKFVYVLYRGVKPIVKGYKGSNERLNVTDGLSDCHHGFLRCSCI